MSVITVEEGPIQRTFDIGDNYGEPLGVKIIEYGSDFVIVFPGGTTSRSFPSERSALKEIKKKKDVWLKAYRRLQTTQRETSDVWFKE